MSGNHGTTGVLFPPSRSGYVRASKHWYTGRDGNQECYAIRSRHYSAVKNRRPRQRQFVGPGARIVLIAGNGTAIFIWRKEDFRQDGQIGVNCVAFRNEGGVLSSSLITEADEVAWRRWPGERHFTFVNASAVRPKEHPGRCFLMAGWTQCGVSKAGLLIFERLM
ncbi:MAG: hypothetical protein ABIY70_08710 [Capsulimonas sp.]|uniref:hypothetical protein n=1 Tax=Capsulimonas sp. TaxID=2494211 RepID=UPI003263982C